jgi:hypothetical protein
MMSARTGAHPLKTAMDGGSHFVFAFNKTNLREKKGGPAPSLPFRIDF